jgi:hypothetical protein
MPRIYTSTSDPLDFCKRCFPKTEAAAFAKYGNLGDGPDGRGNCFGYDDDHPPYDGEDYTCHTCRKRLTGKDDFAG